MPTVSSVVNQAGAVYGLSTKLFGGNRALANSSMFIRGAENTFGNFMKSDFGGQPALTTLVENYSDNREEFNKNLKENMDSLKESADKVKATAETSSDTESETAEVSDSVSEKSTGSTLSTLRGFAAGNIPPELRNLANIPLQPKATPENIADDKKSSLQNFAERYLTSDNPKVENVQNPNEDSRVTSVRNLVRDFNSTMSYLNENRGMSSRIATLADNFTQNDKLNQSLNEIGISVNAQGFLALNESIFNAALNSDSGGVNSILGSDGLAGQLDRNINLANAQGDKLFTSILDFANRNNQNDSESLYGNNANYSRENTPRIFAMLT